MAALKARDTTSICCTPFYPFSRVSLGGSQPGILPIPQRIFLRVYFLPKCQLDFGAAPLPWPHDSNFFQVKGLTSVAQSATINLQGSLGCAPPHSTPIGCPRRTENPQKSHIDSWGFLYTIRRATGMERQFLVSAQTGRTQQNISYFVAFTESKHTKSLLYTQSASPVALRRA